MTAGPLDLLLLAFVWAFVLGLVKLSILSAQREARRVRSFRAWRLEEVGILASSAFVPHDANRYRYYVYQQKLEGIRPKGPQGWVRP